MRLQSWIVAAGLAVSLLLAAAPVVEGQPSVAGGQAPDPAQIALGQSDADGWTQTEAMRSEVWPTTAANAPNAPSVMYTYETQFTRQAADGTQEVLTSRATEGQADLRSARLQALQHDALGQTPMQMPSGAFGWWEDAGGARIGGAAAQVGNMLLELHLSGVTPAQAVSDDQVASWLSAMMSRATSTPAAPPLDWSQVMPGQPAPWSFVLDQAGVDGDWDQQTGLELASPEPGGVPQSIRAAREFSRSGAVRRTLSSAATLYDSVGDAAQLGMTGPGKAIDAPKLGDQAAAFQDNEPADGDAPEVTYTVRVRHGPLVLTTQETGVAYSLDTPDETFGLATAADAQAASLLGQ